MVAVSPTKCITRQRDPSQVQIRLQAFHELSKDEPETVRTNELPVCVRPTVLLSMEEVTLLAGERKRQTDSPSGGSQRIDRASQVSRFLHGKRIQTATDQF